MSRERPPVYVSSLTRLDVPLLQSLAFPPMTILPDEINYRRNSNILKSPKLKRFRHLGGSVVPVPIYPVDWSNLTHLYCTRSNNESLDPLADVLRQASGLVRFDLTLSLLAYGLPYSGHYFTSGLTTLVIAEFGLPRNAMLFITQRIKYWHVVLKRPLNSLHCVRKYPKITRAPRFRSV